MEVKVGIKGAPRELVVESSLSAEEVLDAVRESLAGTSGLLVLADEKGRQILVPTDKLAYVEIGETSERRVGFGAI